MSGEVVREGLSKRGSNMYKGAPGAEMTGKKASDMEPRGEFQEIRWELWTGAR